MWRVACDWWREQRGDKGAVGCGKSKSWTNLESFKGNPTESNPIKPKNPTGGTPGPLRSNQAQSNPIKPCPGMRDLPASDFGAASAGCAVLDAKESHGRDARATTAQSN
jgi:hypothetical protein